MLSVVHFCYLPKDGGIIQGHVRTQAVLSTGGEESHCSLKYSRSRIKTVSTQVQVWARSGL